MRLFHCIKAVGTAYVEIAITQSEKIVDQFVTTSLEREIFNLQVCGGFILGKNLLTFSWISEFVSFLRRNMYRVFHPPYHTKISSGKINQMV